MFEKVTLEMLPAPRCWMPMPRFVSCGAVTGVRCIDDRTQMVMWSKTMLDMSSSVTEPNLRAQERERTVQLDTSTFRTAPWPSVDLRQMPVRVSTGYPTSNTPSSATST